MLEALKIIGALLGIFAFFWKVRDLFSSYLHIELYRTRFPGHKFVMRRA